MLWLLGFLLSPAGRGWGQTGITNEAGLTLFRTGGTEALLTWSVEFDVPTTNLQPTLRLDFGFATSEPDAAATFFDSFSLTLQGADPGASAVLFTADRAGVQWAPSTPGGLGVDTNRLGVTTTNFPVLSPAHALQFAFSLVFVLPASLAAGPVTLFLDLFDNLNSAGSLAWVGNARVESLTPPVRLVSSLNPAGPYTEETGAVLDAAGRTLTVPRPSEPRFFRVVADGPVRIVAIRASATTVVVEYALVTLRVLGAAEPRGPFAIESGVVEDARAGTLTLTRPTASRFFRLEGNAVSRIRAVRAGGTNLVLEYELLP